MYSLKKKDSTNFNGIESYVNDKNRADDISWFPINQALCIRKNEIESDTIKTKMSHI